MLKNIIEKIKKTDYKELEWNGWEVYSSSHSLERNLQRFNLSYDIFEKILKEIIIFFDTCDKCKDTEYLIYSKKYNQGLIIDLFKDIKKFKIITILPPKKQTLADNKTQKIYIESILDKFNFYDKHLTEFAFNNKDYFRIDEANEYIDCEYPIIILDDNKLF
jgi:hypothetical protein